MLDSLNEATYPACINLKDHSIMAYAEKDKIDPIQIKKNSFDFVL